MWVLKYLLSDFGQDCNMNYCILFPWKSILWNSLTGSGLSGRGVWQVMRPHAHVPVRMRLWATALAGGRRRDEMLAWGSYLASAQGLSRWSPGPARRNSVVPGHSGLEDRQTVGHHHGSIDSSIPSCLFHTSDLPVAFLGPSGFCFLMSFRVIAHASHCRPCHSCLCFSEVSPAVITAAFSGILQVVGFFSCDYSSFFQFWPVWRLYDYSSLGLLRLEGTFFTMQPCFYFIF